MERKWMEWKPGLYGVTLYSGQLSVGAINLFIIKGAKGKRSLMVDAGFRNQKHMEQIEGILKELGISFDMLDIFLTHKHHDHCAQASAFQERGARLFMNPKENRHNYDCLYESMMPGSTKEQQRVLRSVGITQETTPGLWNIFMELSKKSRESTGADFTIPEFSFSDVKNGDVFEYGDYCFHVVALPGHTYGQMGLYEPRKKIFFCGDQIINDIIPIVGTSYKDEFLLKKYFDSLHEIKHGYQDCLILPSHGDPLKNKNETVDKIVFSYLDKADRILRIVMDSKAPMTTEQVAFLAYGIRKVPDTEMKAIRAKLVTSKSFSCLEYLYEDGFIRRREEDGILYWDGGEKEKG